MDNINRRSKSQGPRVNPSELLARKRQLIQAAGSSGQLNWSTNAELDQTVDQLTSSTDTHHYDSSNSDRILSRRPSRRLQKEGLSSSNSSSEREKLIAAEAKLESLSERLRDHQSNNSSTLNGLAIPSSTVGDPSKSIDDVYILLAKKEKDLQLAAELGKVLLEKNDQLSKMNERATEEYSRKLELLEQEKYKLKRNLDLLDSEYENRLIELQTDCNVLKNQLEKQQQEFKSREKEKCKLIDDLVQQNQRLTGELTEATKSEELLSNQIEQLRDGFKNRLSNRQDHMVQVDALKEEIQIVNQRKQDLERRLKLSNEDKNQLSLALEESGDKILLLENVINERDLKLSDLVNEINELRDSSSWLTNELESMINLNEKLVLQTTNNDDINEDTNENVFKLNQLGYDSQVKRSQLVEQLRELRLKSRSRIKASELMLMSQRVATQQRSNIHLDNKDWSTTGSENSVEVRGFSSRQERRRRRTRADNGQGEERGQRLVKKRLNDESGILKSSQRSHNIMAPESNGFSQDEGWDQDVNESDSEFEWKEDIVENIYLLLRNFYSVLQQRKESLHLQQQRQQQQQQHSSNNSLLQQSNKTSNTNSGNSNSNSNSNNNNNNNHYNSQNSSVAEDSGISTDENPEEKLVEANYVDGDTEQLRSIAQNLNQWKLLLNNLKLLIEDLPCSNCLWLISERDKYEQLVKLHTKLSDEMRTKDDKILALDISKTEQEAKLAQLEEKCNILNQDLANCDKPKEEIVQLAWKARDEAVERKNLAEISLAKTRIENMQISSQLMEVVQQKGELSLRLAQFEDDIHYITQDSVKAKFTWEEYVEKLHRSKKESQANNNTRASNLVYPLTQLFNNFTPSSLGQKTTISNGGSETNSNSTSPTKSSAMVDTFIQPTSNLVRTFTTNRFRLPRFWLKN